MSNSIEVRALSTGEALIRIDELSAILRDCVEGGASVSFMEPLTRERADDFWRGVAGAVGRGERTLLVAEHDGRLVGTVQLITDMPENQPHRADVAKLLVQRNLRGAGVGQRLMECVHEAARTQCRTVLMLDTANAAAERLYERLGWQRVGVVPGFALMPNGAPCATTFYYKCIA